MLGKTNTHELGGGVTTINPFFGTTRNPVDQTRIAGGSSGGSAAAVVAHLCAAATGSDTGGSVRIPAAFCGCVGFKPTFGKFSTQGLIGACPTFDHVGFLTRTVEDAQICYRRHGIAGTGQATSRRHPRRSRAQVLLRRSRSRRGDSRNARSRVVRREVSSRTSTFPIDAKTMARVFDPIVVFEIWGRLGADWRTNPGSFSKSFAGFFSTPRPSIAEYESALAALKEYQAAVDGSSISVDVIVTPTVPVTAPPHRRPDRRHEDPAQHLAVQRRRHARHLDSLENRRIACRACSSSPSAGDDDKLLQIVRSLLEGV